ncbi:MAG TPA: type II secretion system protein [Candidatus Hydrogenedentes bacterium]|nr:type II secretion system protein [Candidatus Hydrogenedentota bacterium]HQM47812.1 type II secretion system protein [Candidatus Hydrogenedentota bacterium]
MMDARRNRGFTLVELILVIAILGVLSTIGVVMFGRINNLWTQTRNKTELDARAEYALEQVRQDIAAFVSPALTGAPLQGVDSVASDPAFPGVKLASDSLLIPIRGTTPAGGEVLAAVKYAVVAESGTRILTRAPMGLYGEAGEAKSTEVTEGVAQFNVQYAGPEGQWQDAWDGAQPPSAVRVSLVVAEPGRPERQVAREAIFAVHVN